MTSNKIENAARKWIESRSEHPELDESFTAGAKWMANRIKNITKREMGEKSAALKVLRMFIDEATKGKKWVS
jgi:hypothetical protein